MTGLYKRIFQGGKKEESLNQDEVSKQLKKISEQLVYLERKVDTLLGKRGSRRDSNHRFDRDRNDHRGGQHNRQQPRRKPEGLETDLGRQVDFLPDQQP